MINSSIGTFCFENETTQLIKLLKSAKKSTNPAAYLYTKGARNVLFRLQALARVYKKVDDKNFFDDARKSFKSYEDALGQIDYYHSFYKLITAEKQIPISFANILKKKTQAAYNNFNSLLENDKISATGIDSIIAAVNSHSFPKQEEERKRIAKFLIKELNDLIENYEEGKSNLTTLEEGVHEMRREIRWISIYAQSLGGLIQLRTIKTPDEKLNHYLNKATIESNFNRMPSAQFVVEPLLIQSQHFYSLSWLINELGIIKDKGLMLQEVEITLSELKILSSDSKKRIKSLLIEKKITVQQLCEQAELLVDNFIFNARIPQNITRELKRSSQ